MNYLLIIFLAISLLILFNIPSQKTIKKNIKKKEKEYFTIKKNKKALMGEKFNNSFRRLHETNVNTLNNHTKKNKQIVSNFRKHCQAQHENNKNLINNNYRDFHRKLMSIQNIADENQKNKYIQTYLKELEKKNNSVE